MGSIYRAVSVPAPADPNLVFIQPGTFMMYACRAGTTTRFSYGDDPDYAGLGDYSWWNSNGDQTTHPVGEKLPNPGGLFDMYGNVMEWCKDWYGDYPGGISTDPQGPPTGSERVWRSSGFFAPGSDCRSAHRGRVQPSFLYTDFGFRVVLTADRP